MLFKHPPKLKILVLFFIAVVILVFNTKLYAQTMTEEEESFFNKIDSYIRYMPSRSVEATSGKVEIIETDTECSYEFKMFDKLPVKFSLDNKYISLEDTVSIDLPAHLIGLSVDLETTLPFFNFEETYLRIGISPSFYSDDWDCEASAFRILSRFFIIHTPNSKWTFLAGIAVYPDFENELTPMLGVIYKPNDKLTFNLVAKRPNITYVLNEKVTLFAEGGSSANSEFEVTRDSSENVVLQYKQMHLGGGVKLKLNKYIQSFFSVGTVFNRRLEYRDNQGKVNIKDGLYTEFRTEIRF